MEENKKFKCPNCGRLMKKLEALCPDCGVSPVKLPEEYTCKKCGYKIPLKKIDPDKNNNERVVFNCPKCGNNIISK